MHEVNTDRTENTQLLQKFFVYLLLRAGQRAYQFVNGSSDIFLVLFVVIQNRMRNVCLGGSISLKFHPFCPFFHLLLKFI